MKHRRPRQRRAWKRGGQFAGAALAAVGIGLAAGGTSHASDCDQRSQFTLGQAAQTQVGDGEEDCQCADCLAERLSWSREADEPCPYGQGGDDCQCENCLAGQSGWSREADESNLYDQGGDGCQCGDCLAAAQYGWYDQAAESIDYDTDYQVAY